MTLNEFIKFSADKRVNLMTAGDWGWVREHRNSIMCTMGQAWGGQASADLLGSLKQFGRSPDRSSIRMQKANYVAWSEEEPKTMAKARQMVDLMFPERIPVETVNRIRASIDVFCADAKLGLLGTEEAFFASPTTALSKDTVMVFFLARCKEWGVDKGFLSKIDQVQAIYKSVKSGGVKANSLTREQQIKVINCGFL